MNRFIYVSIIIIVFLLPSCSNPVEDVMKGIWTMDSISYKKQNAMFCLMGNGIYFDKTISEIPTNNCDTTALFFY